MKLIDCDLLEVVPDRLYGGATGSKIAVRFDDRVWMLKSCERLWDKGFKNVEVSYANDPITEYLGSHIYQIFGFPVHATILGNFKNKVCVLCSDDAYPERLFEFREFRNAIFDERLTQASSGMSTALDDIMQVIDYSDRIPTESTLERFWQMFVMDSFIGNTDRNNGNWAFIFKDGAFSLYEVYDCGGCLNNKRSDFQMQNDFNANKISNLALDYTFNYRDDNGKRINPFHYIEKHSNAIIMQTLDLFTDDKMQQVNDLIDSVLPVISEVRAAWYKELLRIRFNHLMSLHNSLRSTILHKIEI